MMKEADRNVEKRLLNSNRLGAGLIKDEAINGAINESERQGLGAEHEPDQMRPYKG